MTDTTVPVTQALKPCPFCGSDRITVWNSRDGQQAHCKDCGADGAPAFNGKTPAVDRARAAWNTRAAEQSRATPATTPAPSEPEAGASEIAGQRQLHPPAMEAVVSVASHREIINPPAMEAENARLREENAKFRQLLAPFGAVADEYDRWQRKGSTTTERQVRFGYGRCQFGLPEFRAIRATLSTEQVSQPEEAGR